jgi:hypothetical protein
MYNEGEWIEDYLRRGTDSSLKGNEANEEAKYTKVSQLSLGTVMLPMAEPLFKQHSVIVDMVKGGIMMNVAWPGAQTNANVVGLPAGVAIGLHGLHESPLPGQQVLVGHVDGSANNPIVLGKYGYNASQRIDLEAMHFLPATVHLIGPTDVSLGHHTGSFIALRGTLPLPSQIDMFSLTVITQTCLGLRLDTVGGAYTINVGAAMAITAGGALALTAGAAVSITAGAAVSITASVGITVTAGAPILITAVPSVIVNGGVRPAAASGDFTATIFGPSPILGTGISVLL